MVAYFALNIELKGCVGSLITVRLVVLTDYWTNIHLVCIISANLEAQLHSFLDDVNVIMCVVIVNKSLEVAHTHSSYGGIKFNRALCMTCK